MLPMEPRCCPQPCSTSSLIGALYLCLVELGFTGACNMVSCLVLCLHSMTLFIHGPAEILPTSLFDVFVSPQITSLDWANELPMYAFSLALQWLPSLAQSTFVPWTNDLPMRCQLIASSSPMISHCRFNGNSLGISWQLNGNSLVSQSW